MSEAKPEVWTLDAAAYSPKPTGMVKLLDGVEYPIFSFMDVPVKSSLDVLATADRLNDMSAEERMAESRRIVLILNAGPEGAETKKIPAAELDRLVLRQMVTLTTMALSVSEVPPKADEDASKAPASSAPASAASTAGTTSR